MLFLLKIFRLNDIFPSHTVLPEGDLNVIQRSNSTSKKFKMIRHVIYVVDSYFSKCYEASNQASSIHIKNVPACGRASSQQTTLRWLSKFTMALSKTLLTKSSKIMQKMWLDFFALKTTHLLGVLGFWCGTRQRE